MARGKIQVTQLNYRRELHRELHLSAPDDESRRMSAFTSMPHQAQAEAMRRMAALGYSAHGIARATHLSVEQVRDVLNEAPR